METPALAQRGRATIDFHCGVRDALAALQREVEGEMADNGITAETLPEGLDDRLKLVDTTLAESRIYRSRGLVGEWLARDHGPIARDAFDELRDHLVPHLQALDHGPATLELNPDLKLPDYFSRVWFHRTAGGWDANDYNGYVHGELIHKLILTRAFGSDIFQQRRDAAAEAPRRDYKRILDMGASSGHHTVALADTFPDAEIHGVDFSARMLEHARRVANERGEAWKLYQRACEATGFEDESFDLVSSYNLVHELPRGINRQVLAEAFRILEPGGNIVMADVPRYFELDKLSAWRFDYVARSGGEPYWRVASTMDLVAEAEAVGFIEARGYTIGRGQPYVLVATKPLR